MTASKWLFFGLFYVLASLFVVVLFPSNLPNKNMYEQHSVVSSHSSNSSNSTKNNTLRQEQQHLLDYSLQEEQKVIQSYVSGDGRTLENNKHHRIPDVLIVGAQKAGTSAIWDYLQSLKDYVCVPIPGIEGIPWMVKEAHFFDWENIHCRGLEFYRRIYEHCNASIPIFLDATPGYLSFPKRVRETYDKQGTADTLKIIINAREPVSREISYYHMVRRDTSRGTNVSKFFEVLKDDGSPKSFQEFVDQNILPDIEGKRNFGLYDHWLLGWMYFFNRKQILVTSYDDFHDDSHDFLKRLNDFLDIQGEAPTSVSKKNYEHIADGVISCDDQNKLASAYEKHNEAFYKLLETYPGPPMEKRPFTRFNYTCKMEYRY